MKNIFDIVIDKVNEFKNPTCVGLDPDISKIPNHIKQKNLDIYGNTRKAVGKCFVEFNKGIIDATKDVVGVYKPQMAFYESYGVEGIQAFIDTVQYLKSLNKIVIEDAKRNDIGNTALSYAKSHLGEIELINSTERIYDVDLITINGYLGSDGIKPFVEISNKFNKGAFVLAKTSNKSSVDIQDTISIYKNKNIKHYLMMMEFIKKWGEGTEGSNGYICLGAVIGTTFPKDAKIIREKFPECFFLVPGYGIQGGKAEDIISCFNANGTGAIISSSRQISFAYQDIKYNEKEYGLAAREVTIQMRDDIRSVLYGNKLWI